MDRTGEGEASQRLNSSLIYTQNLNINRRKDAMLGYSSKQRMQFSDR